MSQKEAYASDALQSTLNALQQTAQQIDELFPDEMPLEVLRVQADLDIAMIKIKRLMK
jgi:hypothetical protein